MFGSQKVLPMVLLGLLASAASAQIAHPTGVRAIEFRPDGVVIASGGWDNVIRIWRVSDGKLLREHRGHTEHITSLAYAGNEYLISGGADGGVHVWQAWGPNRVRSIRSGTSFVSGVGVDHERGIVYQSGYDNLVKSFNLKTGQLIRRFNGLPSDAYHMALSPDGIRVAGAGPEGGLIVWESSTGQIVHRLGSTGFDYNCVAFNSTGTHLFAGALNGNLQIFELGSAKNVLQRHFANIRASADIKVHPDGSAVSLVGYDGSIIGLKWEETDPISESFLGDRGAADAVAVSPDGNLVALGTSEGALAIYSIDTGELVRRLSVP